MREIRTPGSVRGTPGNRRSYLDGSKKDSLDGYPMAIHGPVMKVKLSRWGNSLAVRIPSGIASEAALRAGNALWIEYSDGALTLTPVDDVPSLADLLDQIRPGNLHDEVDFGKAVGKEAW